MVLLLDSRQTFGYFMGSALNVDRLEGHRWRSSVLGLLRAVGSRRRCRHIASSARQRGCSQGLEIGRHLQVLRDGAHLTLAILVVADRAISAMRPYMRGRRDLPGFAF
jgi:hypothetical protein